MAKPQATTLTSDDMAQLLAILTDHPSLLRCQLQGLREPLALPAGEPIGLGTYVDDSVLLTKRPAGADAHDAAALSGGTHSPVLFVVSRSIDGAFDEEAIDPFRFNRWLFAMVGEVEGFGELREPLTKGLPSFLARQIHSAADREHVFALFLQELHALGRLDDPSLSAQEAARCLARAIRRLDELGRQHGHPLPSSLSVLVSNGRLMAAARRGMPLAYGLLEGMASCEACGLGEETDRDDARIRQHRQAKAVAFVTDPATRLGFIEVPDGSAVSVGRALDITVSSL